MVPPIHLSRPQVCNCGRDRWYLSRPPNYGREKHTFLRRGIPRPPSSGREKPNIVVVKDLISSSGNKVVSKKGKISDGWSTGSNLFHIINESFYRNPAGIEYLH